MAGYQKKLWCMHRTAYITVQEGGALKYLRINIHDGHRMSGVISIFRANNGCGDNQEGIGFPAKI